MKKEEMEILIEGYKEKVKQLEVRCFELENEITRLIFTKEQDTREQEEFLNAFASVVLVLKTRELDVKAIFEEAKKNRIYTYTNKRKLMEEAIGVLRDE